MSNWERVTEKVTARFARNSRKMASVIHGPPRRRKDTKVMLVEFAENPQSFDGEGRARLVDFVRKTYGSAARHIIPYIQPEEEIDEQALLDLS